jgi:hypothetical protein
MSCVRDGRWGGVLRGAPLGRDSGEGLHQGWTVGTGSGIHISISWSVLIAGGADGAGMPGSGQALAHRRFDA